MSRRKSLAVSSLLSAAAMASVAVAVAVGRGWWLIVALR
jgi:hypothetical protein